MSDRLALPDVNVLFALFHVDHVHHIQAHEWLAGAAVFATTPMTETGLLRLSLNPKVTGSVVEAVDALASLASLRADPRCEFLEDDSSFAQPAIDLTILRGHQQVSDLHLVDLAVRHNAVLVTFDRALSKTVVGPGRLHLELIG